MAKSGAVFLMLWLFPIVLARESARQMIVWNVGQGQ
jgi:hypothetical protein